MVLLADRKRARMFTLLDGVVKKSEEHIYDDVPQKVRHGDDTWDAQDKIFRHIEDHLHRHLTVVALNASVFAKENNINGIIIGGHKQLFTKIKSHLQYPLNKKIKGTFVTELKAPFGEIIERAKNCILQLENDDEIKRYEKSLIHNE